MAVMDWATHVCHNGRYSKRLRCELVFVCFDILKELSGGPGTAA